MASVQPAAAGQTSSSHPYTCNSCQVAYRNIDLQKTHMKSDWHRYNLKRRVASLPPITAEIFTEKVLQARADTTAEADKAMFERACEPCGKTYYSENAYRNHLLSQKHKQNKANPAKKHDDETTSVMSSTFSLGEPASAADEDEDVDSAAEDEFNQVIEGLQKAKVADQRPSPVKRPAVTHPASESETTGTESTPTPVQSGSERVWTLGTCVFCNYESASPPLNVQHMERFHGMFIPEKTYMVNLEGLIGYLQERIGEDHQCISCGKFKNNLFAVQTHMRDKGHCKIPYDTEEDQLAIGDYYDFRSTYSDGEDDEESDSGSTEDGNGGAKLGARRETKATGPEGEELEEGEDGDGWETDSSASSLDSEDLTAVPAEGHIHQYERLSKHSHHSTNDPRNHHQADGWHSKAHKHTHAAFYDEYELHLPSGRSVGHRSLNKYYRQNLYNHPSEEERAEQLLLEGARNEDGVEPNPENQVALIKNRRREVAPRGAIGMAGVSDEKKRVARKDMQRNRDLEHYRARKTEYSYGKKMNNQKHYYYRDLAGG